MDQKRFFIRYEQTDLGTKILNRDVIRKGLVGVTYVLGGKDPEWKVCNKDLEAKTEDVALEEFNQWKENTKGGGSYAVIHRIRNLELVMEVVLST